MCMWRRGDLHLPVRSCMHHIRRERLCVRIEECRVVLRRGLLCIHAGTWVLLTRLGPVVQIGRVLRVLRHRGKVHLLVKLRWCFSRFGCREPGRVLVEPRWSEPHRPHVRPDGRRAGRWGVLDSVAVGCVYTLLLLLQLFRHFE